MAKIKILGLIILVLISALVYLFEYTIHQNSLNSNLERIINEQKSYTQEISKDVFYIYTNNSTSTKNIDKNIKMFLQKLKRKDEILAPVNSVEVRKQTEVIVKKWNKFYKQVTDFKKLNNVTSIYSSIILEKIVKDIYLTNLDLVVEFALLQKIHKNQSIEKLNKYQFLEYFFSILLAFLLLYMFTQVKELISFIQKFSLLSKKIISNSSIRGLKTIESKKSSADIQEVTNNYNKLVQKIDNSINLATSSIEKSYTALDIVESDIEDFLELIDEMNNNGTGKELAKKEDVLIHSLEELSRSAQNLKNLKNDFLTLVKQ
jgi:hypothetical protein